MAIIQALGINSTIFYLFVLVGFFFFVMSSLVFIPYTNALYERDHRTKGESNPAAARMKEEMPQVAQAMTSRVLSKKALDI